MDNGSRTSVKAPPMPTHPPVPPGAGLAQRKCARHPAGGGDCAEDGRRRLAVQRPVGREEPLAAPSAVQDVLRSPGQPLDDSARSFMESRFGHDFSRVRVHADARAAESALAVSALAYTVGQDVVFGPGQYAPETSAGRRLLAHELTHVVQQGAATSGPAAGGPRDGAGRDAGAAEGSAAAGRPAGGVRLTVLQRASRPIIMRTPIFSSTLDICRWLLNSRVFHVSEGGLSVTINARWEGSPEWQEWNGNQPPECGNDVYAVLLTQVGRFFDTSYPSREYVCGAPFTRTWGQLPEGDYQLTISTGNTNPNCCLRGDILVSQQGQPGGAADGGGGQKLCGPDVTQWLIRQIATNAKSKVVAEMREDNEEDWKGEDWGALLTWYDLVKTGAQWDFKKDLGDAINLAPCRQNCHGKLYSVTLDGQCMTYEAAANIHYGYVGRAAGFTEERLLGGASDAQVSEGRGETADDPRDVQAIKKGFALFNAGSPAGLNKSGLEANYYQNLPAGDGDPAGCQPCPTKV